MSEEVAVELREGRKRLTRPRSSSYIAVRSAVYQLTSFSDFDTEKIGAGFFADVFKVRHRSTGEVMVLKLNKNRKNSKQMLSEIQLMNRLSHPNILGFKGSCVHEGQLHALTEYINGGSLEDLLQDPLIELSWSVRLKIARDIARGMAYLHSRGVFHRDLSSRNCLIQRDASGKLRTVVADFGLAAKIKQSRRRSHTEVVGSPYWMAPECLNGKEYCERADVFSYGIVLAEIMSRLPADPDFMPRTRYFGVDFESLKKVCVGCPDELWDLMVQCCQMDPDERPSFTEAVLILEHTDHSVDDSSSVVHELETDNMSCFSEPALRLQDSDEDLSSASEGDVRGRGRGSRQLDSLGSAESFSSCGSSPAEEGVSAERRNGTGTTTTSSGGKLAVAGPGALRGSDFDDRPSDGGVGLGQLGYAECSGSRHTLVAEEEINSNVVKGGERREGCGGGGAPRSPHGCGRMATLVDGACSSVEPISLREAGDLTPRVCQSPALHHCDRKRDISPQGETIERQTLLPQQILTATSEQTPIIATIPDDLTRFFVTSSGQCTSPVALSMASSDFSFRLPTPSTPWAPPPSPLPPQTESHSLPASPTLTRRRLRLSQDVAPTTDTSHGHTLMPASSKRHSTPSLETGWHRAGPAAGALEPSGLHHVREDSWDGEGEGLYHPEHPWRKESLCTNLYDEHFVHMEPDWRQRNRSGSTPHVVPRKVSNYSLSIARYPSPLSADGSRRSSTYYTCNCYSIKMKRDYRLSSSAPDLLLLGKS